MNNLIYGIKKKKGDVVYTMPFRYRELIEPIEPKKVEVDKEEYDDNDLYNELRDMEELEKILFSKKGDEL